MKSANEIAEEVWPYLHKTLFIELLKEARSEALEQAAKIVFKECGNGCSSDHRDYILNKLRELKDKA